ncbi:coatomer subunit alpha [Nematocida minor]|uniref:coatomer subunit alpha n=1 Tax=Nematocida minor TaxID=1912983 RepID=UPI00221FBED3|nr:coatomer subunit alpha [Nematocida minor]KAI5190060.1 coatomer subunit alpha [Nematocida minor]
MEERMSTEECTCIMKEETQRVKSIAFHPSKKVVIAGLHSGVIQGWNYLYRTKIFELSEHEGPVRVVVFHHLIERFASAGDDCLIRIWDYKTKAVETVFKGHTDYIRSIEFHKHLPWIISTSDDQTIRIWNFQSKKQIACLTGHTHYVMCAKFINDKIFASVSLDQTIRIWDYSALVTKSQTSVMDMLGVPEVVLKHIIDGHDRGINWISVQPETSLFATGGDDSTIRIWDASQDGVFEKEILQGHHSHVSSLYYTKTETLLSNSEDGTMKIWDLKKKKPAKSFSIDSRYWCLAMDSDETMFAAGYDTGFSIYSLETPYPIYTVCDDVLYICKNQEVLKVEDSKLVKVMNIQKDPQEVLVHENAIIVNYGNNYIVNNKSMYKGMGYATFAYEKIAVCTNSEVILREIDGRDVDSHKMEAEKIFPIKDGLLGMKNKVLFKIENGQVAESTTLPGKCMFVRYDDSHIVAVCNNNIVVFDYSLNQITAIEEIISVNSLIIKDGCIFYTTPMHIKFAFVSGEGSSFMSIEEPLWLVKVEDHVFTLVAVDGSVVEVEMDMIEFKFKKALDSMDVQTIRECIDTGALMGQVSLACLIRKGFYEEGLNYIEDTGVRLELCLKTKRFKEALEYTKDLHSAEIYIKTGRAAINHDLDVAEECFKMANDFTSLILLYIAGNRVDKIESILFECTDGMYSAIAAIITGNKEMLCKLISLQEEIKRIDVLPSTESDFTSTTDTAKAQCPKEEEANECVFTSDSQDMVESDDTQTIKKHIEEEKDNGLERDTVSKMSKDDSDPVFPSLNMQRLERCLKNVPSDLDVEREISIAKGCVANGKTPAAINSFLVSLHYSINSMRESRNMQNQKCLETAAEYLQGLFSEKIRRTTQSEKTSISCAVFYASLKLDREHKEKAIKAAIPICYKKGNKHTAMELAQELVKSYECTDERIKMLADAHKNMKDAYVIDTSLPFCIDVGEYAESALQCQICKAWSSSRCKTCACCFVSNLQ